MKNKRTTKILSLVLVLVMALSLFPVSASAESYRGGSYGTTGWSSWWNWGWGGWWNPQPEPEPEPEPEEPAPVEEPVEDPAPVEEPIEEPAPVEEPVEDPAPEVEVSYPAVQLTSEEIDGLTVTVDAPEGALPEGTEMTVTPVNLTAVQDVVDSTDGVAGTVLAAADITFWFDGGEIQPNGDVTVTMTSAQVTDPENTSVVHLDTTAADLETAEVEAQPVENVAAEAEAVTFDADHFSVYAVVETGSTDDEARATVNFWKDTNKTDKRATVYVKNADTAEELTKIIYDPGVGTLDNGQIFRGWTDDPNYTANTTPKTVANIRAEMESKQIKEGDVVDYYAMIFQIYNIAFQDEYGATIKTDKLYIRADDETPSYTIKENYVPSDPDKKFDGWHVASGTVSPAQDKYPVNTTVTVSSNVVFTVVAPSGAWLSFNENGKGASYTPPQFVPSGSNTVRPDNPTRKGYTFGGWYTDAACTDGNEFTFGQTLTARTDVYAKWISAAKADYTIIIWKQQTTGNKYDFSESITLNGNSNTNVNTVSSRGSGNDAYARINGTDYRGKMTAGNKKDYTGFHLKEFTQNVNIAPEGTSVVNVYYDRNEYTLTFQAPTQAPPYNNGNYYTSGYYYVYNSQNGTSLEQKYLYSYWGKWYTDTSGTEYTGGVYSNNTYSTVKTITARYGADISSNFPIVGTNGVTYNKGERWKPQDNTVGWSQVMLRVQTMPAGDVTFRLSFPERPLKTMNYYVEALPTDTGTVTAPNPLYKDGSSNTQVNPGSKRFKLEFTLNARYTGVTSEDLLALDGFTFYGVNKQADSSGRYIWNSDNDTINIYYTRDKFQIIYNDGKYLTGDLTPVSGETIRQHIGESGEIYYGANLGDQANAFQPTVPGYTLEGWYLDEACSGEKFDFANTTMPKGGIQLYAKWVQTQYRVFLHPNVPETDELEWGQTNQQMNFRVTNGDKISGGKVINGDRAHRAYELIGWFTDPSCSNDSYFNFDTKLNDTTVTASYDKTKDFTDTMNKYGRITDAGSNSDVNRSWITRKLDLYAKWRAVLVGATGINVVYDPADGYGEPNDTLQYLDNSESIAQAASKPNDTAKQFKGWVLQTWNGSEFVDKTGDIINPGDPFTVLKADAQQAPRLDENGQPMFDDDNNPLYTYTVKLKAVYDTFEAPDPTHINWYSNVQALNGISLNLANFTHAGTELSEANKGWYVIDKATGDLQINEAVNIRPSDTFSYNGLIFLGWAKKADATKDELFLKWVEGENGAAGHYEAKNKNDQWVTVTQVAADEKQPYDDLYAIWEPEYFYVFHSSNGTLEAIPMIAVDAEGKYDLTTKAIGLYGGYYEAYHGVDAAKVEAAKADAKNGAVEVNGAETYNGDSLKNKDNARFWVKKEAAKVLRNGVGVAAGAGNEVTPQANDVFYLKELPTTYLANRLQYVYDTNTNEIKNLYMITAVDDTFYSNVGFEITMLEGDKYVKLSNYVAFKRRYESNDCAKIVATDLGVAKRGYVGAWDGTSDLIKDNIVFKVTPFWTTLDGVKVRTTTNVKTFKFDGGITIDKLSQE